MFCIFKGAQPLRKKCPYSELFWSAFFPHMGKQRKNADQNNSEYGHFLHSEHVKQATCGLLNNSVVG